MTGSSNLWRFGGSSVGQPGHISKFAYDPISNRIAVGAMDRPEGAALAHGQLAARLQATRVGEIQYGHVGHDGTADMYSRAQLGRGGKMNPYEAGHKARRAVEHAYGSGISWKDPGFTPSHNRWDIDPPSVDYVDGQPPILEANDGNASKAPEEDEWSF